MASNISRLLCPQIAKSIFSTKTNYLHQRPLDLALAAPSSSNTSGTGSFTRKYLQYRLGSINGGVHVEKYPAKPRLMKPETKPKIVPPKKNIHHPTIHLSTIYPPCRALRDDDHGTQQPRGAAKALHDLVRAASDLLSQLEGRVLAGEGRTGRKGGWVGGWKKGGKFTNKTGGFVIFWILSTIKSWSKGKTWNFWEGKLGCEESIM